jgi:hypothetical protein
MYPWYFSLTKIGLILGGVVVFMVAVGTLHNSPPIGFPPIFFYLWMVIGIVMFVCGLLEKPAPPFM